MAGATVQLRFERQLLENVTRSSSRRHDQASLQVSLSEPVAGNNQVPIPVRTESDQTRRSTCYQNSAVAFRRCNSPSHCSLPTKTCHTQSVSRGYCSGIGICYRHGWDKGTTRLLVPEYACVHQDDQQDHQPISRHRFLNQ